MRSPSPGGCQIGVAWVSYRLPSDKNSAAEEYCHWVRAVLHLRPEEAAIRPARIRRRSNCSHPIGDTKSLVIHRLDHAPPAFRRAEGQGGRWPDTVRSSASGCQRHRRRSEQPWPRFDHGRAEIFNRRRRQRRRQHSAPAPTAWCGRSKFRTECRGARWRPYAGIWEATRGNGAYL